MKVTVPVGVPEPGGSAVTVAHTVTDSPQTEGLGVAVTVVVVVLGVTNRAMAPVEGAKQGPSPL
ncbi:hypothetical protein AN217_12880 [Streptomyces qinglanensis]|uniref:Uncharacterized protein n=1 Tax=Streptomyces qinglanensis TaxID=943816 RepID=A0A1E7K3R2_9ACTN|nr:hypothetical protein AN217_12880 [Streptomyces qinglanensis]OEV26791.1 hypothetical protein AN220_07270 [Streptomyces nanshensis]